MPASPHARRGVTSVVALVSIAVLSAFSAGIGPIAAAEPRPAAERTARTDFWLTILHNNDGESQLLNAGEGLEDFGGVARFVALARDLRAGADDGVLMLSSGDNFLAGPEFSASLEKGVPFYDSLALRRAFYDAIAIGNHEFDFGPDVLADFIRGFRGRAPFLSVNLDVSAEPRLRVLADRGVISASAVVETAGEEVGVIGATTPQLRSISSPRDVVVDPDVAGLVNRQAKMLTKDGVDKIVLISHLQSVAEDRELAGSLRRVDVMIAGGGDELLANDEDLLLPGDVPVGPYPIIEQDRQNREVPIVTTSGGYRYVGRLMVGFNRRGRVVAIDDESGPVRVSGVAPDAVEPDPVVQSRVVEPVTAALAELASTVVGTSEVALDGTRTNIRTVETNQGNLIADALLWQATQLAPSFGAPLPDIGLQNGGGIRNESVIGPGEVSELDTFDMLPFANFVSVVPDIPAAQLKELLENAVSRVELVDGRFTQVAGFSFSWDPDGTPQVVDDAGTVLTPGSRVVDVTLDDGTVLVDGGAVVAGAPAVSIATIDFSARGGDQYPYRGAPFTTLGVTYQQALRAYIETGLSGSITAADYPEGGEGRITRLP
jgi:5'-nucleotidase